jgi:hypothetical protein
MKLSILLPTLLILLLSTASAVVWDEEVMMVCETCQDSFAMIGVKFSYNPVWIDPGGFMLTQDSIICEDEEMTVETGASVSGE